MFSAFSAGRVELVPAEVHRGSGLSTPSNQPSSYMSPWVSQILCKTQQAAITSGASQTSTSSLFSKHVHLPVSLL